MSGERHAGDGSAPRRARRTRESATAASRSRAANHAATRAQEPTSGFETGGRERRLRAAMGVSAGVALLGIAVEGTTQSTIGAALVLLGAVGLMYTIHKYGRLGPEGS